MKNFIGCLFLLLLCACQTPAPQESYYLPSRQGWEGFPQAISPPPECINQERMDVDVIDENGDHYMLFFLSCWGKKQ